MLAHLELLVEGAEPGSLPGVGAAGDLVDLVLELLQTCEAKGVGGEKKGKLETSHIDYIVC